MAAKRNTIKSLSAIWQEYEAAEVAHDVASVSRDCAAVDLAREREMDAYGAFVYAVPQSRADILLKLAQSARGIRAAEGSDQEWPGLEACVGRVVAARDAIEQGAADVGPLAAVRAAWRELVKVWGPNDCDSVMLQTIVIGMSQGMALRLIE